MPDQVLWQFGMQLVTMAVTGLAGWLAGRIRGAAKEREAKAKETNDERDLSRAATRLLLFYRLHDIHHDATGDGRLTVADKHQAEELYETYHQMGGNGTGTQLYKEIMALPTK